MSWLSSDTGKNFWTWILDGRAEVMEVADATEEVNATGAMDTMNEMDG